MQTLIFQGSLCQSHVKREIGVALKVTQLPQTPDIHVIDDVLDYVHKLILSESRISYVVIMPKSGPRLPVLVPCPSAPSTPPPPLEVEFPKVLLSLGSREGAGEGSTISDLPPPPPPPPPPLGLDPAPPPEDFFFRAALAAPFVEGAGRSSSESLSANAAKALVIADCGGGMWG